MGLDVARGMQVTQPPQQPRCSSIGWGLAAASGHVAGHRLHIRSAFTPPAAGSGGACPPDSTPRPEAQQRGEKLGGRGCLERLCSLRASACHFPLASQQTLCMQLLLPCKCTYFFASAQCWPGHGPHPACDAVHRQHRHRQDCRLWAGAHADAHRHGVADGGDGQLSVDGARGYTVCVCVPVLLSHCCRPALRVRCRLELALPPPCRPAVLHQLACDAGQPTCFPKLASQTARQPDSQTAAQGRQGICSQPDIAPLSGISQLMASWDGVGQGTAGWGC